MKYLKDFLRNNLRDTVVFISQVSIASNIFQEDKTFVVESTETVSKAK